MNAVMRMFSIAGSATLLVGAALALDKVRAEIRSDQASAKYGVTGKGVIFAMIDRGIDWQNNDFRNADGTTRIAYIFDLTDNTGSNAADNPYGKGTIYAQSQINQALQGGPSLAERDYLGHGTANTAIVAGNGRNNPKYRGIAPDSTIISVKLVNDSTPAFGNTPAVPAFYDPTLIPVAIDFVVTRARALGMPCVMVMDIGSIAGPTDGTSWYARLIDSTVGNQPGLIFIPGTGDDGGMPNHAGGNVSEGGSVTLKLRKGSAGALGIDIWYDGLDALDVAIRTPDSSYGPFPAPPNNAADFRTDLKELAYYHYGAEATNPWLSMNGKREISISLNADSPSGEYAVTLTGRTVANGRFDATMNPSREWDGSNDNFFENFIVPGSISDFASARNAVVDTCYVIRTAWTDLDGITRTLVGQGNVGQIWAGTSVGPTFDGRQAIDISSPAEEIVTTYDPKSYWATARFNEINDGKGLYGMGGANSSSNPVTAGVIALMLQMNPKLNAFTVKDVLHKSARVDSFTGVTPNPSWGYGKIDALNALDLIHGTRQPTIESVVDATLAFDTVVPGEMFTIFGSNLGPTSFAGPDELSWDHRFVGAANGTEVLFDGVPAPMFYTSSGQIGGIVPYSVAGRPTTSVQVLYEGVASAAASVCVTPFGFPFFLPPSLNCIPLLPQSEP